MNRHPINLGALPRLSVLAAVAAGLATAARAQDTLDTGDTAWVMVSAALVLFMTLPGLALFYGGMVRSKNVLSVLMQCFSIACIVTIVWVVAGYSLVFDDLENGIIGGLGMMFLHGMGVEDLVGTVPESAFSLFQLTFAIITVALVMGSVAERIRFSAVVLLAVVWTVVVYAPIAHWVWGGGWLHGLGVLDFAGGNVVHINAGVAGVVAALVLGRRRGYPSAVMIPHNMTFTVIGGCMLWIGWFGFNGGSALAANHDAAMAMLVTHVCASAAALSWVATEYLYHRKASVLGIVTGMVGGLVAITPASGFVGPGGALAIGIVTGPVCYAAVTELKRRLPVDDSLDVFPVHGIAGILGTVLVGVFVSDGLGVLSGRGLAEGMTIAGQLGVQLLAVLVTVAYTAAATFLLIKAVDVAGMLRVGEEEEELGLDLALHEEQGYRL